MTRVLSEAKTFYDAHFLSVFGPPRGSSEAQIAECERVFGCKFPDGYREFLLWMGNDTQGVFQGSEWFCRDVFKNTESLDELLSENGITFSHTGKPLCFFMHQGYMASWFYIPCQNSDPDCYFFSEAVEPPQVESSGKFSKLLLEDLVAHSRFLKR